MIARFYDEGNVASKQAGKCLRGVLSERFSRSSALCILVVEECFTRVTEQGLRTMS